MEHFTEVLVFERLGDDDSEKNGTTPDMLGEPLCCRSRPATAAASLPSWSRKSRDPASVPLQQLGSEVRFSNGAWDSLLHRIVGGQKRDRRSRESYLCRHEADAPAEHNWWDDHEEEEAGDDRHNKHGQPVIDTSGWCDSTSKQAQPSRHPLKALMTQEEKNPMPSNDLAALSSPMARTPKISRSRLPLLLAQTQPSITAAYCTTVAPAATWMQCSIQRIRQKGSGRASKFVLQNESGVTILTAKRNKLERTVRIFFPVSESTKAECIGIANYDMIGSRFVLYSASSDGSQGNDALMALMLGVTPQGPREMRVVLPKRQNQAWMGGEKRLSSLGNTKNVSKIFQTYGKKKWPSADPQNNFQLLKTSMPKWDPKAKMFQMGFGGRVTMTSVKNMKLERFEPGLASHPCIAAKARILPTSVFMCGRTEADNIFTCDFMAPLTPLEAFCIAIANLIHKPIYQWM